MRALKPKIKNLFLDKAHAVLFFESDSAPDHIILNLLNKISSFVSQSVQHVIIACKINLSHIRLSYSEEFQVLFSLKKNKNDFFINKVCIKNDSNIRLCEQNVTFKDYEKEFSKSSKDNFIFSLNELFSLIPIAIPKPWGQEIWYSGIESRGVSQIQNSMGVRIPLSWIVSAVPSLIFGKKFSYKDPILIKILDPFPEEVIGDLYYELHCEKNEVYVVLETSDDQGKIKIGLNAEKLELYNNDIQKYKTDFLNNILEYEKIRRKIDAIQDPKMIPNALKEQEVLQRKYMDDFCGFLKLNVGDVINVPIHVPHALQHGVKVLEFQTPTYERLIISFAQKVLTQKHWDTKHAFDLIKLEIFKKQTLKILFKTKNVLKELVCKFSDFKVHRWTINANTKIKMIQKSHYHILFIIRGKIAIRTYGIINQMKEQQSIELLAGMCTLVPQKTEFVISSNKGCVFLLCEPI